VEAGKKCPSFIVLIHLCKALNVSLDEIFPGLKIMEKESGDDLNVNKKSEKCKLCYLVEGCMLTIAMSELCGGPWKDKAERADFIREHILGIKKKP